MPERIECRNRCQIECSVECQNICQNKCQNICLEMPWWGSLEVFFCGLGYHQLWKPQFINPPSTSSVSKLDPNKFNLDLLDHYINHSSASYKPTIKPTIKRSPTCWLLRQGIQVSVGRVQLLRRVRPDGVSSP